MWSEYTSLGQSSSSILQVFLSLVQILDDLSRHACAYREIYLLLRRPAGREAYPGEIFFVHSRLLERSAKYYVGLSVTRVGSIAQWYGMKYVAGFYKLELAQFVELQSFSQFAADLGQESKNRLTKGLRLVEILKQSSRSPISLTRQVGILSLANQKLLKALAIKDVDT